ncbi:MAG: adenosine deaminase [Planctomycetes bacterium]|nr:adenosine deaminase [Planctomycetota bacterium]
MSVTLDRTIIQQMPKVLLHDHLDGGLRPQTVIELAREQKKSLPTEDPAELADWFFRGANRGSLSEYLEGFGVTCGLMQDENSLRRVARELIEDLHADGVVYTEVRFAPMLHTGEGLNYEQVMTAVIEGLREGAASTGMTWGLIVCALRNMSPEISLQMAELAVAFRNRGAVGFDLAGDEMGHPPKAHLDAFHYCQRENFNITIHAGEAFGKASIWQALQYCGAHRIGHCTRLAEDMMIENGVITRMGTLAAYVRDRRIPLEICLSSNVHTGAVPDLASHPFMAYFVGQFRVTLNTDNRLMSRTSMTEEYLIAHQVFGLGAPDLEKLAVNAMKSAFISHDERIRLIYDEVKSGYGRLRERGLI